MKLGSGPLFFITRPWETGSGRVEIHLVVDPEASSEPREFLRVSGAIDVLHRFDRNRFLLRRIRVHGVPPGGLFLLDTDEGAARYLLDRDTKWLKVEGPEVLFAEVLKEGDFGYKLGPGPAGREKEIWVQSHPEPRLRLWTCDIDRRGPAHEWCPELVVEKVLEIRSDGLWVVTAETPRRLCWISRDGRERTSLLELDPVWIPALFTHEFSPSGRFLALGIARKDSFFNERDLLVIDARTGKKVIHLPRIRVTVSAASSHSPRLLSTWLDEGHLRFSETTTTAPPNAWPSDGCFQWVDIDITTGKRLVEKKYSDIALWHEKPSRESLEKKASPRRWAEGMFERSWTRLYYKGEESPVDGRNDLENEHPTVSPDGRWGTFASGKAGFSLYLVDAQTKRVQRITSGWCYDLKWLPGVR